MRDDTVVWSKPSRCRLFLRRWWTPTSRADGRKAIRDGVDFLPCRTVFTRNDRDLNVECGHTAFHGSARFC